MSQSKSNVKSSCVLFYVVKLLCVLCCCVFLSAKMRFVLQIHKYVTQSLHRPYEHTQTIKSCARRSHEAQIIDGKAIAEKIKTELKEKIAEFVAQGNRSPTLTAILVGNDPASQTYVKNKMIAAKTVGIVSNTIQLPETTSQEELFNCIKKLNNDAEVDGILVQLPVPNHINERIICNAVASSKDVDGFNEVNIGRLALDMNTIIPATPLGVYELLRRTEIPTIGKNVVVIGRSKNVGMPTAMLLHTDGHHELKGMDATVTICHRNTPPDQLKKHCQGADIIITAVGKPGLVQMDMVKPGACVIDIGITRIPAKEPGKTKLVGDVDFEEVRKVAGHITPVPGGVGPMTVAMLMSNTFMVAKALAKAGQVNGFSSD
ncbi:PREDICTED: bifunctional methylenetetrahydrofolate dehydrogenase/cyclohydrolase, mitochondrial isoform X1 [Rhagoletis zephyria]|uniref:bifunctional methylenetetrahydrofolate dehydrogenase/cyclohydrolase, mitochondrial isoform X1 n=1 Tax=Rhagoletis zephyria TaxID=28612 RepID=UPI0008112DE7|nr:PREDICTED: bifunctional methylenetetrahydrofolate dehydrogenase/cyclohydrolase, mitochondrial isoform X1 [Rhagoletis zephyria]